jgi:hypothetical protein
MAMLEVNTSPEVFELLAANALREEVYSGRITE